MEDAQVAPGPTSTGQRDPGTGSFLLIVTLGILLWPAFLIGSGNNTAALVATIFFFAGSLVLYFSPAIVGVVFDHPNSAGITILNLFLGWTVIGWVGALVWAFTVPKTPPAAAPVDQASMRTCPFCAEPVRAAAIKCKHCGSEIEPST